MSNNKGIGLRTWHSSTSKRTFLVLDSTSSGGVTSITATPPLTAAGTAAIVLSTSMNTNKLIGRGTAGVGVMEEITLGTGLSLSGITLNVSIAALSPLTTKGDLFTYSTVNDRLAVGANGTLLMADSSAATGNKWTTPTYPNTATLGKILIGDGTNIVASTPKYPNASVTAGKIIRSDGTDYAASTFTIPDTYATGDVLYASTTNVLTALAKSSNAYDFLSGQNSYLQPISYSLRMYNLLGGAILGEPINGAFNWITSTTATLGNGSLKLIAVYLPQAATLTGVLWYQTQQGDYTASNYNGVGLYTYSGGTLTLVASSTDDGTIWKAAATTTNKKAFSSTYPASAGIFFIGVVWNRSAQVTAPGIGIYAASGNAAIEAADFTNSAKLNSTLAAQTSLPSSQAMSGVTGNTVHFYFALY